MSTTTTEEYPMDLNLDILTDLIAQVALDQHLGRLTVRLPPPEVIEQAITEAYERLLQVMMETDSLD